MRNLIYKRLRDLRTERILRRGTPGVIRVFRQISGLLKALAAFNEGDDRRARWILGV